MEPADPIQEAIRLQVVRLGQQAGEITALHQGMEAIRANIQHLVERLTPQMVAQPMSPPPSALNLVFLRQSDMRGILEIAGHSCLPAHWSSNSSPPPFRLSIPELPT